MKYSKERRGAPDCTVSNDKFYSMTLHELAMKAIKKHIVISSFNKEVILKTDINPKGV